MASISEQRLKEMEAEMNRFEQEIAPPDGVGAFGMIIGSNTFNTVEAQLRQIRHETTGGAFLPPPPPPPICISQSQAPAAEPTNDLNVPISALAPPPPPPPPPEPAPDQQPPPLMSPPPPPPPLLNRPAFVPPQLRHRAPLPPRPPMHHNMGHGPHGYHGPPGPGPMGPMGPGPGPYHHPNMMGPGPMGPGSMGPGPMGPPMMQQGPMGFPPQGPYHQQGFPMMGNGGGGNMMGNQGGPMDNADSSNSAVIEAKPKMIYSAAPVRTVPKKTKKGKREEKAKTEESAGSVEPSSAEAVAFSSVSMSANIDGEMFASPMGQDEVMATEMELDNDVSMPTKKGKKEKKKKFIRTAANTVWEDPTLEEWDPDDFRMFCGDLGNEVTDESLQRAFGKYPTFVKAKVVRDRRTNKTKGYGFASFKDPQDFTRAMREMNGKYVGNRPIKLRKSTWKDRNIEIVRKKEKEKKRLGLK